MDDVSDTPVNANDCCGGQPAGSCPMDGLLRLLMGPWTTYIIWVLETQGTQRFGQLKAHMPDISAKVLTERLRLLESAGLVSRDYKPSIPPSVSYTLTPRGHELREALDHLSTVARRWQAEDAAREATRTAAE
jgi:DNA-binding HxlR family transcriptional regulator